VARPVEFNVGYTEAPAQYPQARGMAYITETHIAMRGHIAGQSSGSTASLNVAPAGSAAGAPAAAPAAADTTGPAGTPGAEEPPNVKKLVVSFKDVVAVERVYLPGGMRVKCIVWGGHCDALCLT